MVQLTHLYPYQLEGAGWLASRRFALLADEMGLGKTVQAIIAAERVYPPWPARCVVVCPAVVRDHWRREIVGWGMCPHVPIVLYSLSIPCDLPNHFTLIVSYEWATKHVGFLSQYRINLLILDEVHYLKSPGSRRSQAVLGHLVHSCERVWMLSGTPLLNHPGELWPIARILNVTSLTYHEFCGRYSYGFPTGPLSWRALRPANLSELRSLFEPHMLRRLKKDVLTELPSISYHTLPVPLDRRFDPQTIPDWRDKTQELQAKLVEQRHNLETFLTEHPPCEETYRALAAQSSAFTTLMRYTELSKTPAAIDWIREYLSVDKGLKLVVFNQFIDTGAWLMRALHDFGPVRIYGATTPRDRDAAVSRFNGDPRCRLFVGQIQAAGVGINLARSGASDVLFVSPALVPAHNEQAAARVHRPPQTLPVVVRFMCLEDSLDGTIVDLLSRKTRIVSGFHGGDSKENENSA